MRSEKSFKTESHNKLDLTDLDEIQSQLLMSVYHETLSPENGTWDFAPQGWKQLFGSFPNQGISVEWHDFEAPHTINWEKSFHEDSLEICLNVDGGADIQGQGSHGIQLSEKSFGFYTWNGRGLKAIRNGEERHSFMTIELSKDYLRALLPEKMCDLCPLVRLFLSSSCKSQICPEVKPLSSRLQTIINDFQRPSVPSAARPLWFQCKAVEIITQLFFEDEPQEFFCVRQKRVAHERVEKVKFLLKQQLEEPLSLKALSKTVGCSPFYLSRTFSQETGTTIPKFLRQLRIERAAELLRSGKYNVTEAAFEVGYSSLSHFTKAFHETMGCCPGLYPFGKR